MTDGKPPAKPGKATPKGPFLGDEDLNSELDAWDATFDALHTGPEEARSSAHVMEWPAPSASPPPASNELADPTALEVAAAAASPLDRLGSEFDAPDELDDDLGVDRDRPASATAGVDTLDGDLLETDFSGLGADRAPSALGDLLGRSTTAPPLELDEDDDPDDIYTSASRPVKAPPGPLDDDDDDLAPPPMPEPRRGPAIVRRTVSQPIPRDLVRDESELTPPHGHDASVFAEQTRIADTTELEPHTSASRQPASTEQPVDYDAYDDIEIGDEDKLEVAVTGAPAAPVPDAFSSSRRTAHVLRRNDQTTRPPPTAPVPPSPIAATASEPVIEMDVDEELSEPNLARHGFEPEPVEPVGSLGLRGPMTRPRLPSELPSEDDFSDVAAAVGAADDLLGLPGRPVTATGSVAIDFDEVIDERSAPRDLDDALAELAPAPALPLPSPPPASHQPYPGDPDAGSTNRGMAPIGSHRPPALTDLYPRVKTPTSVPPLGARTLMMPPVEAGPRAARVRLPTPAPLERELVEVEPVLDLDAIGRAWPEQVAPMTSVALDETFAAALLVYEREVATVDDSASSAALRIEAGRLSERLLDAERARTHYDAALLADPRATAALRGLRRIARASGDLLDATHQLESEIAVAGALERRPLGHYRIDLLMASGDQDMARVAVGEMLDTAPSDVRALLAHLELAFLDGRADEFGNALEQLAHAVSDHELRAAAQSARGALAAYNNDQAAAIGWYTAAAEADPAGLSARLGAVRYAAAQADPEAAARALTDLARRVEANDPTTAAAAAIRAQQWLTGHAGTDETSDLAASAALIATTASPSDPLVARLGAEGAATTDDTIEAGVAFAHWASCAAAPAERAYAAARAAELDPGRGAELWQMVLDLDPGDDYAAAQLRTAHVASDATESSIEVDLAVAADVDRERARLRAAYGLIAQGRLDAAITVLMQGREVRPTSLALAEALGEALAAAGKWTERAKLFAELAAAPGDQLDREVAQLRSALAWEEAVGAATVVAEIPPGGEEPPDVPGTIRAALDAWELVLDHGDQAPTAHAAAIVLAARLGDRETLVEVLARAQAAERSPWAAASLGLRRARLHADDPQRVEAILRELQPAEDPRRTVGLVMAAARMKDLGDAAAALEERANTLEERSKWAGRPEAPPPGSMSWGPEAGSSGSRSATEVAALRLRAAQLALDAGHAPRATKLLGMVEQALPGLGVVPDLLAAARRRAGDRPSAAARRTEPPPGASASDAFARIVRDADLAAAQGDGGAALALYQRALDIRPGDPLATVPLIRIATQLREPAPVTGIALAQLRIAEDSGDSAGKATAYELLAQIDGELRADSESAQISLESAAQADPSRIDLIHRLERQYAVTDQLGALLRLRKAVLATVPDALVRDRAALLLDIAGLATRENHTEVELADLYRAVLDTDPATRLALLHLESIVRRSGFSDELARLEEQIAGYFDGDPKTQAAFLTRAGETLAELGQIDAAVQRFGRAEAALPGHVPALEGWRQAALKGQLWIDVAEAAARQAAVATEPKTRAALHHFAGVALMDKALVGEQAMSAFRHALDADPGHKDAFLRLRILLEEDANHDDLASLLAQRLHVETDHLARIELHRALAELHRNFLSDRDTAKEHYRAILADDPNDLRAHAAVADIAWEQGAWQEAAEALMARARLEHQPEVLKTLCFRLGLIYADRLVDVPMALKAFQRALIYQPDDENTLVRLADLATQVGEFKLALGACERLVKNETDPDRRATHLHRVARIFKSGFGDVKRAERALNLALDGAPTNDDALQQLVQFYKDARDIASARVHLNRVSGAMRARVQHNPHDGIAYRVIARAMTARAATGFEGSLPIARAAAQLAELLGTSGEPEQKLLMESPRPDLTLLSKPEADDVLFPRGVQVELRQIFQLLGDRIAKHVGVDLRPYGATRGDRLRARENPVAAVVQSVATALGFGEVDVYISNRQPWVMVAEPTSPVSIVIGSSIAATGGDAIRFAAGGALKLAQASLAIPARLPPDDLGVLVVALMRLFQPEFPMLAVDADNVATQLQKLRRLIPTGLVNELRPYALAIDPKRFGHRDLARDLKIAGLRAGLVASSSLLAGLRILAGQVEGELPGFLADPVAQGLITFALSEDHAVIAR